MDKPGFRRKVLASVVVEEISSCVRARGGNRKIGVHKKPAKLHAKIFHRERLIGQVANHIVAILNPIVSIARRQIELIIATSPWRAETVGNGLVAKYGFGICVAMVLL